MPPRAAALRILLVLGLLFALPLGSRGLAAPGDTTLVSTSDLGVKGNGTSAHPAVSGDGTKVAFHSFSANLTFADTDTAPDVYVKDLATGDITLASTSGAGVNGNHSSTSATLTADGNKVAFGSMASNLDVADVDGVVDVYIKEIAQAELSVTKTDSPSRVPTGRNLTYTLAVENHGPDGAPGVRVTDRLPSSVTFVSVTPSQGSCTESNGTVDCNLGTVQRGATPTVEIVVTPRSAGRITNIVSLSAPASDPVPGNNTDSEDTTVCRITSRRTSIPCG